MPPIPPTITRELLPDKPPRFNWVSDRPTYRITVTHKDVLRIGPQDPFGLLAQLAVAGGELTFEDPHGDAALTAKNVDVGELFLEAKIVEITGTLWMAATRVEIRGNQLRFVDVPGQRPSRIITTPLDPPGRPGECADGREGEAGGLLTLRAKQVQPNAQVMRFMTRGGRGESAGEGRRGHDGRNYPVLFPGWVEQHGADIGELGRRFTSDELHSIVRYQSYNRLPPNYEEPNEPWGNMRVNRRPGDAVPGGRMGKGGRGGDLGSVIPVPGLYDLAGGPPGDPAATAPGGKVLGPRQAVFLQNWGAGQYGIVKEEPVPTPGADAPAPQDVENAASGVFSQIT
jgi:hypothetical protein